MSARGRRPIIADGWTPLPAPRGARARRLVAIVHYFPAATLSEISRAAGYEAISTLNALRRLETGGYLLHVGSQWTTTARWTPEDDVVASETAR